MNRHALTLAVIASLTGCLFDPREPIVETVVLIGTRDVDILFVIDNSGSMAEEQLLLAENFSAFINVLEDKAVNANYRIGITTTDNGNPRCLKTTPESGDLTLTSCIDRVDANEFIFLDADLASTCTANCNKGDSELLVIPTTTQYGDGSKPRAWVERFEGQSNIQGVDSNVEAFQCFGPQGVAGCGFEAQLESMYRALEKSTNKESRNYGFLRESAILSIIVITDEADCSYKEAQREVFLGNKIFWHDPENDLVPTSSLCWNAGVSCTGTSPYEECHSVDLGVDGKPATSSADAVLRPVAEYVDFVKEIETGKRMIDDRQRAFVSLIAGVPVGYDRREADLVYADSTNESYQSNMGIGPGCVIGDPNMPSATAVPPVREREFAEAFIDADASTRNLYSICQDDYSSALDAIANRIRERLEPLCMPRCVADTNPDSATIEPNCTLYEDVGDVRVEIPECVTINGKLSTPNGATVCHALRIDPFAATPSEDDDMSTECIDKGANLEFLIVRSIAAPLTSTLSATCELSDDALRDCPAL